ncbi:MAG: DUF3786 domain-containing protein [Dehalococcoidales bacterium]|nr:DUF3786 domain-containing protein [Dehalococcoidales bacterium]
MESKQVTLPNPQTEEYGDRLAYRLAKERFSQIADINRQCLNAGAQFLADEQAVRIEFIGQSHRIALKTGEVSRSDGADVPIREKILVLHYLTQAKGTYLTDKLVTYKELKEGINYFPVFAKRAITPLVNHFGKEPQNLLDVTSQLGGHKAEYGDTAVTVPAFPRVPVTLVLWRGDAEFPPEGSVLFDSTVSDYLTNDDIHALCEIIVWKLVKLLKNRR